jgi:hypothetical protein
MGGAKMGAMARGSSSVRAWGDFAVALGVGLLLGLLVLLAPVVSIALVVGSIVLAVVALARKQARPAWLAAGALVGSGALYLYGAITTTVACLDDRCGGGDPWPLVRFALVVFGLGLAIAAISLPRRG